MAGLLDGIDLAGMALPNRMVMAPMTRTRATEAGVPTPLMAEYYAQRASAGLIVTECVRVSDQAHGIIRGPGLHHPDHIARWRAVVEAVHAAGGRIFCQLWHCGRMSHPAIRDGEPPVAPSAIAATGEFFLPSGREPYPVPRALALGEIAGIVADFARAATAAKAAGFDGVELHGAFGYLPDQFLQDGTNRRDDAYGGAIANRARFLLEVVEAMIGVWGRERVGVKLSPSNRVGGISDSDARATFGHVITQLDAARVGYLHLMEPSANDLKSGTVQINEVVRAFRPMITVPLIANGGFTQAQGDAAIGEGLADLVSFGTLFLANPDLPARFRVGAGLNPPDPATFYGEGPKGYTDYPALAG